MREQHNLLFLLTPPSLPEGICSRSESTLEWRDRAAFQPCTRHRRPACQRAHARMGRAARAVLNHGVSPHTPSYYDDRIVQKFSLLRRAYPNGGAEQPFSLARDVGSYLVRKCILAHYVPATRAFSPHYPIIIVRGAGLAPWLPIFLDLSRARLSERYSLSALHAPPPSSLPESACSNRMCAPHAPPLHTIPLS